MSLSDNPAGVFTYVAGALVAVFLVHGTASYYLMRPKLEGMATLRGAFEVEKRGLRDQIAEKGREISDMQKEAASLRERFNTLKVESRDVPDLKFLGFLAEKFRGLNALDDDPNIAEVYRGRPVVIEALDVADFFTKPGSDQMVVKFPPAGLVSRVAFPRADAANAPLASLDRKRAARITFVGRIREWNGQFELDEGHLLGIRDAGK